MIEQVAKALAESGGFDWEELSPRRIELYKRHAKIAIKAMREPTPEIKRLLFGVVSDGYWEGLIDAILEEK